MASVVTQPANLVRSAATQLSDVMAHITFQEGKKDVVAEIEVYSRSAEILACAQNIQKAMNVNSEEDDIDWTKLYDQKNKTAKTDYLAKQFKRINETLKKILDCPPKKQAQKLCEDGVKICKKLAQYAPDGKRDKVKSNEVIKEVLDLVESAQIFDCKSKNITKSPAISPKPPMMYKEEQKSENTSASQRVTENARFVIEQNRAELKNARETYEKCVENLEKNQKELTDILVTMRNCELKEIDFKTTIKMLVKGMDAMGRVKEQWEKMVHFFQMVSNIVKTSLSKTLTNFVSTSEKTQALSYNEKLFSKDLLYTQAFQACNIASLVHMISATYTDVSNKYLMDRVSSLGRLMAMDKSKPEFEQERTQLQNGCDEAQKGILRLVLKNKDEYDQKSTARLKKIDRELLAILPAAPPEQIKSIQKAVQAGFSKEEEEEAYI
ncbi:Cadherin-2 [Labeo rohita]|uniref:Cadherin-2 n=1 Tax=Labeo rohita TaxID=84645 RepID=A0ABQ8LXU7_LABRO|nr:Cadherin-2 [Labeo rohita]